MTIGPLSKLLAYVFFNFANCIPHVSFLYHTKAQLYRLSGVRIGSGAHILGPIIMRDFSYSFLVIGHSVFINSNVRFGCEHASIVIGDRVLIGPNVSIETTSHDLVTNTATLRPFYSLSVQVEDDVWLAARSIILPGVTIGKGSVVAAGSVVTEDVNPYTLVAGVPARYIKSLTPDLD